MYFNLNTGEIDKYIRPDETCIWIDEDFDGQVLYISHHNINIAIQINGDRDLEKFCQGFDNLNNIPSCLSVMWLENAVIDIGMSNKGYRQLEVQTDSLHIDLQIPTKWLGSMVKFIRRDMIQRIIK